MKSEEQLYLNSAFGNIKISVREVYRDAPHLALMAEVEIAEDIYPYEKGDIHRVPYTSLVHFDK